MQPAAASAAPAPRSWRTKLAARLQQSWLKRDWLAIALYDVSLLYRGLVALRRWLYARGVFESARLPVPVIVVGNVVAGGAGKTPVVIEIVQHLQRAGWQPGVVSRGYGRTVAAGGGPDGSGCIAVTQDTPVALSGDEPALVHHATGAPVWVGADRANAALALLAAHPGTDVIVSDDGLQHLALRRDIEICVFDARGVGNGWLLPSGPLREPWPRTPAVDFVLHTGAQIAKDHQPNYAITRQLAPYAVRADDSRTALADLQGQALHAVAAIAQPEAFFSMLRQQGLTLAHTTALPDHYNLDSWLNSIYGLEPLICTEKDAVKLWQHCPQALAVPLVVNLPDEFLAAVLDRLAAHTNPPENTG